MSFFVLAPFDIVIIEIDADKAVETDLFGVTLNLVKKVTIIVMKTIRQVSYRMNLIFILAFGCNVTDTDSSPGEHTRSVNEEAIFYDPIRDI